MIGWDYWMVSFHTNSDVAVYYSSQGRFFSFFYVIFSKKVIFGKQSDFWTRLFEKWRYWPIKSLLVPEGAPRIPPGRDSRETYSKY